MIDEKRLAELMEPEALRGLAVTLALVHCEARQTGILGDAPDSAKQFMDAVDCAAAVLQFVANEHEWQSLDIMRETPREPGERFSAWHGRCRVKILKARIAGRAENDKVIEVDWDGCMGLPACTLRRTNGSCSVRDLHPHSCDRARCRLVEEGRVIIQAKAKAEEKRKG